MSKTYKTVKMSCTLDGRHLSIDKLYKLMTDPVQKISISEEALERVVKSRTVVDKLVTDNKIAYGITTGFGSLKNCVINPSQLQDLQHNLIKSHACGTGPNLPLHRVRGMLALRINTLLRGCSGVTVDLIKRLVDFFNKGIFSRVPEQGTVGASGDLAPLAHLMLGYLGIGELWDPSTNSYQNASEVLKKHNLDPAMLNAKEGLALINGTQFITTHAVESIYLAKQLLAQANGVAALTLEALHGTFKAFDARVSENRPHPGQIAVSQDMRMYLAADKGGSARYNKDNVQDAYSLRCIPQVHGVVYDTLQFVNKMIETELNSATDNPLVLDEEIISAGNFHGQYPASACDYLAIAMTTLGNISERRIERLVNGSLSKLPSFLIKGQPGLNSGVMILQYCAAALASENRVLSTPASVTSIPTCENQEDHVSMGGFSARKLLQIINNVYHIVAIELFCAVQAYEFSPEQSTAILDGVVKNVRKIVPSLNEDRYLEPDIEKLKEFLKNGQFPHVPLCKK